MAQTRAQGSATRSTAPVKQSKSREERVQEGARILQASAAAGAQLFLGGAELAEKDGDSRGGAELRAMAQIVTALAQAAAGLAKLAESKERRSE